MSRRRRDTLIATATLVAVALLTISPAGADLRRALSARNSATVDGVKASLTPHANALVALNSSGQVPRRTIRPGGGARGLRGEAGPQGAMGVRGVAGHDGPGASRALRGTREFGPFADSFDVTAVTATSLSPGTWLAIGTAELSRASGGEFLAGCEVTDGLTHIRGTLVSIGAEAGNTGMLEATSVATGIFRSDLPFDIALRCDGTRFGNPGAGAFLRAPQLVVAPLPAASVRLTGS
jgi:hypothetical protein